MGLGFENEEVIDETKSQPTEKLYSGWTTLLVLWIFIISSLAVGIRSDFYIGLGLVSVASITQYFNSKTGNSITLVILILGSFSLVDLFFITTSISFGIKELFIITIDIIIVALLIFHSYKTKIVKIPIKTKEEKKAKSDALVNRFKNNFKGRFREDLESLSQNTKMSLEARTAAKELLEEM